MTFQRYLAWWQFELSAFLWVSPGILTKVTQFFLKESAKAQVNYDQELIEKVIPNYEIGCKRIVFSTQYLPMLANNKDKVKLITEPIKEMTGQGVRTKDGKESKFDVVIFATGFNIEDSLFGFELKGRSEMSLRYAMLDPKGPRSSAYLGITIPDFPNFFTLLGPNTTLMRSSVLFMIECQSDYIIDSITQALRNDITSIEVKEKTAKKFGQYIADTSSKQNLGSASCVGWYKNSEGKNIALWPSNLVHYWWLTRKCELLRDFKITVE